MSALDVFLLILAIVGIIALIYFIISMKNHNERMNAIKDDLKKLNTSLEPIIANITVITDKIVNISEEAEKRFFDISDTIQNVKSTVSKFSFLGGKNNIKSPIQDLLSNVNAISKGVAAFWRKLNN